MMTDVPTVTARAFSGFPQKYIALHRSRSPFIRIDEQRFVAIRAKEVFDLIIDDRLPQTDATSLNSVTHGMASFTKFAANSALYSNGDEHRARRRSWGSQFSHRNSQPLQPQVKEVIENACRRMHREGGAAFVGDFCQAIPQLIVCEMLGIDPETMDRIRPLMPRIGAGIPLLFDVLDGADIDAACFELEGIVEQLIRKNSATPSSSFLTQFLTNSAAPLTQDELISTFMLLIVAGINTTRNALATQFFLILKNRECWDSIRADRDLIPAVVSEALRFEPAVGAVPRTVPEDRTIAGHHFAAGTHLILSISAALQEPDLFPEPEVFNPMRPNVNRADMRFGRGAHRCVGQPLARMILETALEVVSRHYPNTVLDETSINFDNFGGVRRISDMSVQFQT
jgi:hypothetical protein